MERMCSGGCYILESAIAMSAIFGSALVYSSLVGFFVVYLLGIPE